MLCRMRPQPPGARPSTSLSQVASTFDGLFLSTCTLRKRQPCITSDLQWLGGLTPEHLLPIIEVHCIKSFLPHIGGQHPSLTTDRFRGLTRSNQSLLDLPHP
ncbi:uncharacterized protein LJ206_006596 isoform 1-T1 [Theristicus caerulescens]